MQRRYIVFILLSLSVSLAWSQKKELSQARTYIKSGKDLDKAEKLMVDLLKDPANRTNPKVYLTWYETVMMQYQLANEKLYLKQKYDTAAFFNLTRRMYQITESFDSLDAQPNKKGKVDPSYRKSHAETMNQLRPNLYFGGTYNLRRNNYAQAFDFFETYIDADRQPLFTGYDYHNCDTLMPTAAYWATLCGHRMQDAERTLKYHKLALEDHSKAVYVRQYVCEAYLWQKNDSAYLAALEDGFVYHPDYPYFFPRLVDYYNARGDFDSALLLASNALVRQPNNPLFLLAKSLALLNLERYDDCIAVSETLIQQCDTLSEAYYNIATCYLNQALALEQKNEPRLYRDTINGLYAKARPYMESYRRLAPDDKRRWAPALYRIYLNLNMGRQFEEIDRLLWK